MLACECPIGRHPAAAGVVCRYVVDPVDLLLCRSREPEPGALSGLYRDGSTNGDGIVSVKCYGG
ncbi:hypothetical protein PC121_g7462 [Phytophthora cactorum]|nr:hypothetical protein PC120_g14685 [Phytophthora cactorum]KAG3077291.1 hypothetical protein PC121_g7462 [Phytophthora cactorum]